MRCRLMPLLVGQRGIVTTRGRGAGLGIRLMVGRRFGKMGLWVTL